MARHTGGQASMRDDDQWRNDKTAAPGGTPSPGGLPPPRTSSAYAGGRGSVGTLKPSRAGGRDTGDAGGENDQREPMAVARSRAPSARTPVSGRATSRPDEERHPVGDRRGRGLDGDRRGPYATESDQSWIAGSARRVLAVLRAIVLGGDGRGRILRDLLTIRDRLQELKRRGDLRADHADAGARPDHRGGGAQHGSSPPDVPSGTAGRRESPDGRRRRHK